MNKELERIFRARTVPTEQTLRQILGLKPRTVKRKPLTRKAPCEQFAEIIGKLLSTEPRGTVIPSEARLRELLNRER